MATFVALRAPMMHCTPSASLEAQCHQFMSLAALMLLLAGSHNIGKTSIAVVVVAVVQPALASMERLIVPSQVVNSHLDLLHLTRGNKIVSDAKEAFLTVLIPPSSQCKQTTPGGHLSSFQ